MTKKHLLTLLLISFFTSFLVACSTTKDKEPQPSDSEIITPRLHQAAHQDKRAALTLKKLNLRLLIPHLQEEQALKNLFHSLESLANMIQKQQAK
ncbi:phage protein [Streptococcus pyogenes]|nr:phage protein [Streptococcus pyogenes]